MHGFDQHACNGQQAKREQRLHAAFKVAHASPDFVDTLNRVGQPDGQHQRGQSELVAKLVGTVWRTQIDRHHGTNFFATGAVTMLLEVGTNGAGDTTEQHIVDGAIQRLANRLNFNQRDWSAPGHPLGVTRDTLQPGGRIVGHERKGRQIGHGMVSKFGQIN